MSVTANTNQAQRTNLANVNDDPHGLDIYEEKPNIDHLETSSIQDEKVKETSQVGDYSGFTQKTDPKEIKLVRKLDLYIMVRPLTSFSPWLSVHVLDRLPQRGVRDPADVNLRPVCGLCTGSTTLTETPSPWPNCHPW